MVEVQRLAYRRSQKKTSFWSERVARAKLVVEVMRGERLNKNVHEKIFSKFFFDFIQQLQSSNP